MHNSKLSSIKLTISTHKVRTMAVYKRKASSVKKKLPSTQWLFLNNHYIVLTDTGSNGGVGHSVLAVVREYFYYWSG